ncbi:unnamed protein product, partial [Polarella glacialis]
MGPCLPQVRLRTRLPLESGPDKSSLLTAVDAASALWFALRSPLLLEWEVEFEGGFTAVLAAELSTDTAAAWPPKKCHLSVAPRSAEALGAATSAARALTVPSAATPQQLSDLLLAGSATVVELAPHLAADVAEPAEPRTTLMHPQAASSQTSDIDPPAYVSGQPTLVNRDDRRQIFQPLCLQQWNHDVCGHHALFSLRCLLRDQLHLLRDEQRFWRHAFADVESLVQHGEASGRWPKSSVIGGIVDEMHLRYLVSVDRELIGRATVASTSESLREQLASLGPCPEGRRRVHGFLLPAATHWYSAAVVDTPGSNREVWFFDSYNWALASMQTAEDIETLVECQLEMSRGYCYEKLRLEEPASWLHRPEEHL